MSLIGNPDTPASYVADYMQACVGMFGIPAGGFTSDIETYGAATNYDVESLYAAMLNGSIGRSIYAPGISNESFATKLVDKVGGGLLSDANKAAAIDEVQALLDGGLSHAATAMAVVEFVAGLETSDETYGAVAQQFQNRIEIANYYTFSSTSPSSTLSTLTAILVGVDNETDVSDPAAVLEANTDPGVTTGQTYTLTTVLDTITGTSGNDTIIADNTGSTKTLSVADQINGGAGTDTLKVYLASTDTSLTFPSFSGIETLEVNGGALSSINASTMTGLTSLVVDSRVGVSGTGTATTNDFTYTLAGQSLTLKNAQANSNAATAAVVSTTTVASTTDTSESITLSKFTDTTRTVSTTSYTDTNTIAITGDKVTSLTLTSSGTGAATDNNSITLTNSPAKIETVTIKGDTTLKVIESLSAVKTIDASAATGKVTVDTSGGTANAALAFTGGSANDKITFASSALVSTQTLKGGDGTDTLVIKDTAISSSTTALNKAINQVTSFETLGFAGSALSADVSKITAMTTFSIEGAITGASASTSAVTTGTGANGTEGALFSGESNSHSFVINAALTGGNGQPATGSGVTGGNGAAGLKVTAAVDGGSNALNLTLSGVTITGGNAGASASSATAGSSGMAVDAGNFETINITSNTNAAATVKTNTFTGGDSGAGYGMVTGANATINISGAAKMDMGKVYTSTNANFTINAANLTGDLTVETVGSGNDIITGGAGINLITLNGGIDTVDLSKSTAKADVITFGAATATPKTGVVITGFTNALNTGDKLDLLGSASVTTSGTATANTGLTNAVTATINSKGIVTFSAVGADATLSDHVDAALAAIDNGVTGATNKVVAFVYGDNAYVVQENTASDANGAFDAGTDLVVKLTGVTSISEVSASASGSGIIYVA